MLPLTYTSALTEAPGREAELPGLQIHVKLVKHLALVSPFPNRSYKLLDFSPACFKGVAGVSWTRGGSDSGVRRQPQISHISLCARWSPDEAMAALFSFLRHSHSSKCVLTVVLLETSGQSGE